MSSLRPDVLEESARRIERWLLESEVQLEDEPHRGAVAGWLDRKGRPEFVYLEITGYYLTTMAWLAGGAASSEESASLALERGRKALDWMRAATESGELPPTRLYLTPGRRDWRNAAIFSFDLAMAARGACCFASVAPAREAETLVQVLAARLLEVCGDAAPLGSHVLRNGHGGALPNRWSTRPGPHHIKAAAALLRLPRDVVDPGLAGASQRTALAGAAAVEPTNADGELHPLLYGLEGLLMLAPTGSEPGLEVVERAFERLAALQAPDGSLPAAVTGSATVRSDVLAQALRVGALLRAAGRLQDESWAPRLDALASALLRHVREDGSVLFTAEGDFLNAWCAMFAHQALLLHARTRQPPPGDRASFPVEAIERLI